MGEILKGTAGCLLQIVFFVLSTVQFFAIMAFAGEHWGLGGFLSFIVAALLAYIPVVGAVAGICGAIYGWGWAWWAACLLFGFPYIFFLGLALLAKKD